jgi:hypothetical protein
VVRVQGVEVVHAGFILAAPRAVVVGVVGVATPCVLARPLVAGVEILMMT